MTRPDRPADPLSAALRDLPRERASSGFTAGVMHRLDEPRRSPVRRRGWLVAAATALAIVAAVPVAQEIDRRRRVESIRERTAALLQEKAALERQARDLRDRYEREAVVYLGGDEEIDLVVDMRPLVTGLAGRGYQPAVYRTEN